jgi:hypothetical protein
MRSSGPWRPEVLGALAGLKPHAEHVALAVDVDRQREVAGLVSEQITSSVHEFGLIGVTFVLATWQLALSIVIVAGATTGAALHERHQRPESHNVS